MRNELCYYCNLSTFKSIIQNQTFWLSDLHYMNDSAEESWFLGVLSDVMRKFRDSLSDETKEYLDKDKNIDAFFSNVKYCYKDFAYICCFTDGKNDDLSQWRGYASDGTGLCIGFKKDKILLLSQSETIEKQIKDSKGDCHFEKNCLNSRRFRQKRINYLDKDEIMNELEEKIASVIEQFDNDIKEYKSISETDSEISYAFFNIPCQDKFAFELLDKTFQDRAFYKNKSFKSEEEYRICFFDVLHEGLISKDDDFLMKEMQARYEFENGTTLSELRYREGRGELIPYREMKFTHSFFQEMLSSVTIGPKNPMSVNDVKYFLIANGFDTENITVLKSESTYQ